MIFVFKRGSGSTNYQPLSFIIANRKYDLVGIVQSKAYDIMGLYSSTFIRYPGLKHQDKWLNISAYANLIQPLKAIHLFNSKHISVLIYQAIGNDIARMDVEEQVPQLI